MLLESFEAQYAARAKINLSLHIEGSRPDGYHELSSLMTTIGLSDRLRFCLFLRGAQDEKRAWQMNSDSTEIPLEGDNLCFKAAELFFEAVGIEQEMLHLEIHLDKIIPVAAGLGGGSADAAATLRFLWSAWHAGLASSFGLDKKRIDKETLLQIALRCGADVPFCIEGGTRFCQGVGEIMSPPLIAPSWPILIAKPVAQVRTVWAFTQLDQMREEKALSAPGEPAASFDTWRDAFESGDPAALIPLISNDFEDVLSSQIPQIAELLDAMRQRDAFTVSMTGTGPTCFSLFLSEKERDRAFQSLSAAMPEVRWFKTALSSFLDSLEG